MNEILIESEANSRFKRWKKLAHEARAVKKEGATLLEGIHLCEVVLGADAQVSAVILDDQRATDEARALAYQCAEAKGAKCYALSSALYDQLSPVEHGVGVMCEVAVPQRAEVADWANVDVLYLDGVQDAGNAGTLIRTAVAAGVRVIAASPSTAILWTPKVMRAAMGAHFGAKFVEGNAGTLIRTAVAAGVRVIAASPSTAILWTPKVMRAAMGAHFGAKFVEGITPQAFREAYQGHIYAADARGGEDLFMTDDSYTQGPVTWLMGAEGPGVSDAGLAASDRRFYIPIEAACESLNVMTDDSYTQGPVTWLMGAEGPGVSDAGLAASDRRFYIPIEAACESLNVGAAAAVCLFDTRRRRLQAR